MSGAVRPCARRVCNFSFVDVRFFVSCVWLCCNSLSQFHPESHTHSTRLISEQRPSESGFRTSSMCTRECVVSIFTGSEQCAQGDDRHGRRAPADGHGCGCGCGVLGAGWCAAGWSVYNPGRPSRGSRVEHSGSGSGGWGGSAAATQTQSGRQTSEQFRTVHLNATQSTVLAASVANAQVASADRT